MREAVEDDGDPSPIASPPFPGGVRAAAVIWLILGCVSTFGSCITYFILPILMNVGKGGPQKPGGLQPSPMEVCAFWLGILFGVGFFLLGLRIIRGSSNDTLVGSIVSLLVGVLYLVLGGVGLVMFLNAAAPMLIGSVTALV